MNSQSSSTMIPCSAFIFSDTLKTDIVYLLICTHVHTTVIFSQEAFPTAVAGWLNDWENRQKETREVLLATENIPVLTHVRIASGVSLKRSS